MKKILLFLFSLLISFNSYGLFEKTVCVETDSQDRSGFIYLPNKTKPFTGNNLCEYQNGQYRSKGKVEDGKRDGIWTEWHENGEVKSERNYREGLEVGEGGSIITRYSNGQKKEVGNYIGDKKDGKWTFWNENGQIKSEGNYIEGNFVSETKYSYYENGQKKEENNYINDKKDGKVTEWFKSGQKKKEVNTKDDKLDGKSTLWYENGQKELEENYKGGKKEGKLTIWFENGNRKSKVNFKDDKKDGTDTQWYENGQKELEENYKDGVLDGKSTRWKIDGDINIKGSYKDGKKHGKWSQGKLMGGFTTFCFQNGKMSWAGGCD